MIMKSKYLISCVRNIFHKKDYTILLTNAALIRCVIPRPSSNRITEPSIQPNINFSLSGLNEWQQTCDCNGIDVTDVR